MIRYSLLCPQDHAFEAWFRNSDSYDQQVASGVISCPVCGKTQVRKALMAPAVVTKRAAVPRPDAAVSANPGAGSAGAGGAAAAVSGASRAGAPAVAAAPSGESLPPVSPEQLASVLPDPDKVRAVLSALRSHIEQTHENVGTAFPEEARKIHYGESEERPIYGQATAQEREELADEGIDVLSLPFGPLRHDA